jgi:hypothetical protein
MRAHGRRRRRAARQGGRLAAADSDERAREGRRLTVADSDERARSKQSARTFTNDTAGLLTSLRFSRGASRRRKGGDGGDRRERLARVPATTATRERTADRVWGKTVRARRRFYRDRRRPRHVGPWHGARAGAECGAAGFGLELVWLGRLEDGDDDRDPAVSD